MRYLFVFFTLLHFNNCYSQDANAINLKIQDALTGPNLRLDRFLDSVEFYTFAIQLDVKYKKGKGVVEKVSVNDSIAYVFYKDFDFLKQINYLSLLQQKKNATVVIPVGIIIAYTVKRKPIPPTIKAEELMSKLYKMYNISYPEPRNVINNYIFLNPVICTCGYKVYD